MKGRTTIRFIGGALDGTVEEIQSKAATEELTWSKGNGIHLNGKLFSLI